MKIKFIQKIIDFLRSKKKKNTKQCILSKNSVKQWVIDKGDTTHRLNYNLDKNSIVFDFGGYKGCWTSDILNKYNCKVHIFEVIPSFSDLIKNRFEKNENVVVNNFGLAKNNEELYITLSDDATGLFAGGKDKEKIKLVDVSDYLLQNKITHIDLMKINIEGGEYDLLERLIEIDFIKNIKNLQIQFHNIAPDSQRRMENIQKALSNTHKLTYQYMWCWENWSKNEN